MSKFFIVGVWNVKIWVDQKLNVRVWVVGV